MTPNTPEKWTIRKRFSDIRSGGLVEAICPHGIGHHRGVHGCHMKDGTLESCCSTCPKEIWEQTTLEKCCDSTEPHDHLGMSSMEVVEPETRRDMTPLQTALFERILLRNGGDQGYAKIDWDNYVVPVIEEAERRGEERERERCVKALEEESDKTEYKTNDAYLEAEALLDRILNRINKPL